MKDKVEVGQYRLYKLLNLVYKVVEYDAERDVYKVEWLSGVHKPHYRGMSIMCDTLLTPLEVELL